MKGLLVIAVCALVAAAVGYAEKRDTRTAAWWGTVTFVTLAVLGGFVTQCQRGDYPC